MKKYHKLLIGGLILVFFIIMPISSNNYFININTLKTQYEVGQVWMSESEITAESGEIISTEIYVNSGTECLSYYDIMLLWNPSIFDISDSGYGVQAGPDGFLSSIVYRYGEVIITGFDTSGTGPGERLHILTIEWFVGGDPGTSSLDIIVNELSDSSGSTIGILEGISSVVTNIGPERPHITPPNDIMYEEDMTGNEISWTAYDGEPTNYKIKKDGTIVDSGTWSSGIPITISVDGLIQGSYLYSLKVYDNWGDYTIDNVNVTVSAVEYPIIISNVSDISFEKGMIGNIISWNVTDSFPDEYTITLDGFIEESGQWTSGITIDFNVDSLEVDNHTIIIDLSDKGGHTTINIVYVNILPSSNPIISDASDISFKEGETGNDITWIATDAFPDNYTINIDGTIEETGTWTSNNEIIYNVDNLSEGIHTVIIYIFDKAGNNASDIVIVEVLEDITTTTTTIPTTTTSDTTFPIDLDDIPGYDILIVISSLGLVVMGIILYKKKKHFI